MNLKINEADTARKLTDFIRDAFSRSGFTKAQIAVSGGVDSATSLFLAVSALGPDAVCPLLLPYGNLSTQGTIDAMGIIEQQKIPVSNLKRVDIKPAVDLLLTGEAADQIRRGNVMARMRMIILFDQAKKNSALVVGTENRSEHLLGYFTRFGDEASDVEPLRNLFKTQVYQLAKFLGVPETILGKKPSAGLWPEQTDEGEFGFTYRDADQILSLLIDGHQSKAEIIKTGFAPETVDGVIHQMEKNRFKHELPYLPPERAGE